MSDHKSAAMVLKKIKTIILVPILNEEATLDPFINSLARLDEDMGVLFIVTQDKTKNDSDASLKKIEKFSKIKENIFFIINFKRGLGLAYREGLKYALCKFPFEFLCTMDADGSHDFLSIPDLLKNNWRADIIIASRYIRGGEVKEWSLLRLLGSRLAGRATSCLLPHRIFDPTSGFRLYSRRLLEKLDFSHFRSSGFAFQTEILLNSLRVGGTFFETPTYFVGRKLGRSKLRLFDVLEYLYVIGFNSMAILGSKNAFNFKNKKSC